jgi:hypothetical protein
VAGPAQGRPHTLWDAHFRMPLARTMVTPVRTRPPQLAAMLLPLLRPDAELGVLDITEWFGDTSGGIARISPKA